MFYTDKILNWFLLQVTPGTGANLQGGGYIESVENIFDCIDICHLVDGCELVTFRLDKNRCYLKVADAHEVI